MREDRPIPAHKAVQASHSLDELLARAKGEVVAVPEEDRRAELAQAPRIAPFDGALRPDGHECRRRHVAVGGVQDARARLALDRDEVEAHAEHPFRSCLTARATHASWLSTLEAGGGTGWPLTRSASRRRTRRSDSALRSRS